MDPSNFLIFVEGELLSAKTKESKFNYVLNHIYIYIYIYIMRNHYIFLKYMYGSNLIMSSELLGAVKPLLTLLTCL